MKQHAQLYTLFLILVLCMSCKDKNNTGLPKENSISESKDIDITNSPKSITRTIKQDRNGNIWFATWEGIIQFNGNSFTNITSSVSKSRFFSVLEDRRGNFWLASIGSGVYYYDGKTFENFTTKEGLANNRVTSIYEDKKGDIWFGTEGGVSRYDGKTFQNFTTNEGLTDNDINTIIEDSTGKFWFGTRGDICFYDGKSFAKLTNKEGKTFKNVRHIIEDKNGGIWLGGNDGLWRYDNSTFTNFAQKFVGYIYEDKKGNIWTSSESTNIQGWALSRYDGTTLTNEKATVTEIKAEQGMFFGILEDSDGIIWFGTLNGVYRYDGNTFRDFKDNAVKKQSELLKI
jgi:ligand-binding sensor domain-containing protein